MSDEKEILINKMYSGYNLNEMLGHEAINLITDDKGQSYIYVLSNGAYSKEHFGKIKYVFITRVINQQCSQVLGVATELEPVLENEVINLLNSISNNNGELNRIDVNNDKINEKPKENQKKSNYNNLFSVDIGAGNIENIDEKFTKEQQTFRELIYEAQIAYMRKNNIKVNKKPLENYYKNNLLDKKNKAIYITFKANKFYEPKQNMYLINKNYEYDSESEYVYIKLDYKDHSNRHLHNFISEKSEDYKILEDIVNGIFNEAYCKPTDKEVNINSFWKKRTIYNNTKNKKDESILEFMDQVDNETIYSNMIVNILKNYPKLCKDFLKEIAKSESSTEVNNENIIVEKEVAFTLEEENKKEEGRIDILISSDKHVYVIENKIKSNLNGVEKENDKISQTQLDKYYKYVTLNYENKTPHFFIFKPVYNNIDENLLKIKNSETKYKIITYKDLYQFFIKYKSIYKKDSYYKEFLEDLNIHAKPLDEYHFDLMMRKFSAAIKQAKQKNK